MRYHHFCKDEYSIVTQIKHKIINDEFSNEIIRSINVTGYWKTDHNVTLGQLHFIGPANSHTHALSMH